MFLKELQLTNFKCHRKLYLSFELAAPKSGIRKTTFLLGENGTGKSALLKAVALVTAGSTALSQVIETPDDWIAIGKPYCEIAATITTAQGEDRNVSLRIDRGSQISSILERNKDSLEMIDRAIAHADRNYFVVAYGSSRRLNNSSEFSLKKPRRKFPRTANILSLFDLDAQLVSLAEWAIDLDYTGKEGGIKNVKRAFDSFLLENVKFKEIDREKKELMFSTPDGTVPLSQMSDGYQNVASWVGDMMYRISETFRDFKDPLKARGLLLIDEIDLHLHPKWQRQLHAFLTQRLPNFQVIATTHSPLTAQQANEDELYALRRVDKKVELTQFKGAPNKMLLHQILMSPVFGLESDESLEIEKAKSKIRETSLKSKKTPEDRAMIKKAKEELGPTPLNTRSNGLLSDSDISLLKSINQALKPKRK